MGKLRPEKEIQSLSSHRARIGTCILPRSKLLSFHCLAFLLGDLSGQNLYLRPQGHFLSGKEGRDCRELSVGETVGACELSWGESTSVCHEHCKYTGHSPFLSLSGFYSHSLFSCVEQRYRRQHIKLTKTLKSRGSAYLLPENKIKTNKPIPHEICHP